MQIKESNEEGKRSGYTIFKDNNQNKDSVSK